MNNSLETSLTTIRNACPQCRGIKKAYCHTCGATGTVRIYEGLQLFWGKRLDIWHVTHDRFIEKSKHVWLFFLLLLSFIGKAFIVSYIVSTFSSPITPYSEIWFDAVDYKIAFGWISLFIDLYIYYFLTIAIEGRRKISKLKKRKEKKEKVLLVNVANYTTHTTMKAVENAWILADKYDQPSLMPFHVFSSLLDTPQIKILFARIGITYDTLSKTLAHQFASHKTATKNKEEISIELREIFIEAFIHSYQEGKNYLSETSLLLSIAKHNELVQEILYDLDVSIEKLDNVVHWVDVRIKISERYRQFRSSALFKPKGSMDRAMTALATPFLDRYSTDLTGLARQGYLELIIGREDTYKQFFRLLESGKNGIVFVGPSGVGKTSILHGLAQFMTEEQVPEILQDKRLINLDAARLVSGATPSVVAERLLHIADEIIKAGNIVLTIENVNSLIGISTGGEDSMDLVDVLGSVIAKKQFYVIATSEPLQYKKVSTQATLGQIFKIISVQEPDENLAIRILESKTMLLEYKHKVFFSYDSIVELIKLSYRYMPDEYMPAKAIGILEEIAIAKAKDDKEGNKVITVDDVAKIVSEKIKIPVSKVSQNESEVLLQMENLIHKQLIDQEQAVTAVSEALRRARAELITGERPIANFLFLGPTGVGKTQLAKTVADVYFGSAKNMIRLDMSEYQDVGAINKLIGSEGEPGNLTRAVKKQPFSILLLDEIEKSHPDVLNIFLQVMDDGRLTDGTGRTIDFTNIIIMATSNSGSQFIQDSIQKKMPVKQITSELLAGELRAHFKPEFLNRFDGIIVFKPLSQDDVFKIAKLMVSEVISNLEEKKGVTLIIENEALIELAQAGYKPEFGARPMRRIIQNKLDTPLATLILEKKIDRRDTIRFTTTGLRVIKAKKL